MRIGPISDNDALRELVTRFDDPRDTNARVLGDWLLDAGWRHPSRRSLTPELLFEVIVEQMSDEELRDVGLRIFDTVAGRFLSWEVPWLQGAKAAFASGDRFLMVEEWRDCVERVQFPVFYFSHPGNKAAWIAAKLLTVDRPLQARTIGAAGVLTDLLAAWTWGRRPRRDPWRRLLREVLWAPGLTSIR